MCAYFTSAYWGMFEAFHQFVLNSPTRRVSFPRQDLQGQPQMAQQRLKCQPYFVLVLWVQCHYVVVKFPPSNSYPLTAQGFQRKFQYLMAYTVLSM